MPLIAANEGELVLLDTLLDNLDTHLHLYKNNYTPDADSASFGVHFTALEKTAT